MTQEQKKFADDIIKYFKDQDGSALTTKQIDAAILKHDMVGKSPLTSVLAILVYHHVLLYQPTKYTSAAMVIEEGYYILTDKGWAYENFDKILGDKKRRNDLEQALITSSIASNKSIKFVNKLFWLTAFFAFFSALGTMGTFILELRKTMQRPSAEAVRTYPDTTNKSKR
jgi:hypothetical protein